MLSGHQHAGTRLHRSIATTRENPVATAILRRATALARGDHSGLRSHARTFADLGCHYQQRRTETLLGSRPDP